MDTSKENILRLADIHIRRYSSLMGRPNTRLDELVHYLELWKSTKRKANYELLTKEEKYELHDAIGDEE